MFTLEVLNPVAQSEGEIKVSGAAHRPRSLDDLTLGLLWNSKRGGEIALVKAGELIRNKFKDVKVIRYDGSMPCEKALMERAKQECDIFIGSTGD
ncbi:MAG: hypothetical protein QF659_03185 [Dehalococcoidia bacterium]|jgi:hypothetical protein|nr:hypothetical protein [Dehalococcoidia bacterium]